MGSKYGYESEFTRFWDELGKEKIEPIVRVNSRSNINGDFASNGEGAASETDHSHDAGGHQVFGPPKEYEGQLPNGMTLTNPTGGDVRLQDNYGHGYYGAPRPGGASHAGIDIVGIGGQPIVLPFTNGTQTNIGSGFDRGVMVTHPSGKYRVLLLHINPQTMAVLDPAQYGYHGMTPHVHFQLEQNIGGHWRNVNPHPIMYPTQQ